jgi:hypothetical protein
MSYRQMFVRENQTAALSARVTRPAGFSNDEPGRGLHDAQLAFELRHLGREHGTDRLHCLRSPVGMPLDGGAYFLDVLPGPPTSSRASSNIRFNHLEAILQTSGADGPGNKFRIFAQQRKRI